MRVISDRVPVVALCQSSLANRSRMGPKCCRRNGGGSPRGAPRGELNWPTTAPSGRGHCGAALRFLVANLGALVRVVEGYQPLCSSIAIASASPGLAEVVANPAGTSRFGFSPICRPSTQARACLANVVV